VTIPDALLAALFCFSMVFVVLACLYALLRLFSLLLGKPASRKKAAKEGK